MRVGVIGCGVVGACVGWHLAHAGAQDVLVDAGLPGAGVSNWSFSWVNASNKTETRAYLLSVAGLVAHHQLAAELGRSDWWHPPATCAGPTIRPAPKRSATPPTRPGCGGMTSPSGTSPGSSGSSSPTSAFRLAGYYEAVTHSGITLGVIVGRPLAQEIMDGTVHELLAPYRPGRLG